MRIDYNYCGDCKHWHEIENAPYKNCRLGKCDKIADGTPFECEGETFLFGREVFEDESYDDDFRCFEEKEI